MYNPFPYIVKRNTFWLSPERCIFWEDQNTLILSDLHLGKTGHFRKEGIAIPHSVYKADLQRLIAQLYFFKVDRLIIAGDLTHSASNKELDLFLKWRKDFSLLQIDLVKGNHDILGDEWYREVNISVSEWKLKAGPFVFLHDPEAMDKLTGKEKKLYGITGHVHPAIGIKGRGKQSLRFPCYYFTADHCILPAFSRFTGSFKVSPKKNETVFAIAGDELVKVS